MARIRTIKPEFFTSSDIVCMSPLSRLFYVSLWCEADREGRLNWSVKTLKFRYFPADDCDVEEMANELVKNGLIVIYEVDGKQYAEIPTFKSHQVINNREQESTIPERNAGASFTRESGVPMGWKEGKEEVDDAQKQEQPILEDSLITSDASFTRESGVQGEGKEGKERKGKEGKGKEGTEDAPISKQVIDYLNLRACTSFRHVKSNIELIDARAKEGASLDDFKRVIDAKCAEWSRDEKMRKYLRPETLFNATKFNGYLGSMPASNAGNPVQCTPSGIPYGTMIGGMRVGKNWV